MDETLDILPGEGDVEMIKVTKIRKTCEECGEPAHYRHTFLLPNARRNSSSSAYGRDDCSYCMDAEKFVCREHNTDRFRHIDNYEWCSTFRASARFAHLFLEEFKQTIDKGE